jgi:hypothetical protein
MLLEFIPVIYNFLWIAQQLVLENGLQPKHCIIRKFIRIFYKRHSISAYDTLEAICTSLKHGSSSLFDGDIWHHQTIGFTPGVDHHYRYYYNILSKDF